MLSVADPGRPASTYPPAQWATWVPALAAAASLHVVAATLLVIFIAHSPATFTAVAATPTTPAPADTRRIIFIARDSQPGGGGGGGGNQQRGPIRHAQSVGTDAITLRIAKPASPIGTTLDTLALPAVVLDAKPLASGTFEQVGLPVGGVSFGTSTGPGSGGGVGDGVGTGIGSGRGPGIGPGSGGGTGGGVYRPGGAVTTPRVIVQVKPAYTAEALSEKIQGTVVLEFVVQADGQPADIRVARSLDRGLDEQAVLAARQWRFEPGRLAGQPVDVLVTLVLDFNIR